jgi:hypothetical protein
MIDFLIIFIIWAACIIAGACAGSRRNSKVAGGFLGAFLGPLGVIAALGLDSRPKCPHCGGRLDGQGLVCQHCGITPRWQYCQPIAED